MRCLLTFRCSSLSNTFILPHPCHSSCSTPHPPVHRFNDHSSSSTSFSPSTHAFSPEVASNHYTSSVTHPLPFGNAGIQFFCNRQPTLGSDLGVFLALAIQQSYFSCHTPHRTIISTILRFHFGSFCFCRSTLLIRWSHWFCLHSSASHLSQQTWYTTSLLPHLQVGHYFLVTYRRLRLVPARV